MGSPGRWETAVDVRQGLRQLAQLVPLLGFTVDVAEEVDAVDLAFLGARGERAAGLARTLSRLPKSPQPLADETAAAALQCSRIAELSTMLLGASRGGDVLAVLATAGDLSGLAAPLSEVLRRCEAKSPSPQDELVDAMTPLILFGALRRAEDALSMMTAEPTLADASLPGHERAGPSEELRAAVAAMRQVLEASSVGSGALAFRQVLADLGRSCERFERLRQSPVLDSERLIAAHVIVSRLVAEVHEQVDEIAAALAPWFVPAPQRIDHPAIWRLRHEALNLHGLGRAVEFAVRLRMPHGRLPLGPFSALATYALSIEDLAADAIAEAASVGALRQWRGYDPVAEMGGRARRAAVQARMIEFQLSADPAAQVGHSLNLLRQYLAGLESHSALLLEVVGSRLMLNQRGVELA